MSRISRCGETRGIPHGRTPASSPSRARDDERGGRRARPSPKRGARARAGSSPVHRRFIADSSPVHRRFIAGSWLVHGWFMAGSRGHGATPAGAASCPKTARAPIAARMMRADGQPPPNERIDRTRRSNTPIKFVDHTCRSNTPTEHADRTRRSNSSITLAGRTHQSNSPVEHTDQARRATGPRYCVAPCSPCIAAGFGAARSRIPISAATIANAAPSMNAAW